MSSIVLGVVLIIAVIGIGCVIAVMYSNAQSMDSEVSKILQRLQALEGKEQPPPRLCSTHGHVMEAVYDENKGSDLSESKISALSEAARRNGCRTCHATGEMDPTPEDLQKLYPLLCLNDIEHLTDRDLDEDVEELLAKSDTHVV